VRRAALSVLVVTALLMAAAANAGLLRPEQKQLRAADNALAKRTVVRASDLASGWARKPSSKSSEPKLDCPGVDLDFSRFTITGTAQSTFTLAGAAIESSVEVYESRRDAAGDFRKGSSSAALGCFARELDKEARKDGRSQVVAARSLGKRRVGDEAMAYRILLSFKTARGPMPVYLDLVAVRRGRTLVTLAFTAARAPIKGQVSLARAVAARAR